MGATNEDPTNADAPKEEVVWPMPENNWGCFLGGLAFAGVFVLVGAAVLYFGFIKPRLDIRASQSWVETPCVILESEVDEGYGETPSSMGRGSYDYSLRIRYRYKFDGQAYESNRYGVTRVADTSEGWRRKVVGRLPAGAETVCFVDPQRPERAALSRELHVASFSIVIPIVFLLVGLLGVLSIFASLAPDPPAEEGGKSRRRAKKPAR